MFIEWSSGCIEVNEMVLIAIMVSIIAITYITRKFGGKKNVSNN